MLHLIIFHNLYIFLVLFFFFLNRALLFFSFKDSLFKICIALHFYYQKGAPTLSPMTATNPNPFLQQRGRIDEQMFTNPPPLRHS